MSRLIRIFTVCLVNLFFIPIYMNMKQTRSLSEFSCLSNIPDFTLYGGSFKYYLSKYLGQVSHMLYTATKNSSFM